MPLVKCEVNSCTHWMPDNICAAGNIDILYEEEGKMAREDAQTECKTFHGKRRGVTSYLGSMDNVDWPGMVAEPFAEGRQANPSVTCVVESCKYWAEGDQCEAETIEVTGEDADECQDTNCKTFERKEG